MGRHQDCAVFELFHMNGYTLFINCYRLLTFINRRFRLKGLTTDSYLGIYKRQLQAMLCLSLCSLLAGVNPHVISVFYYDLSATVHHLVRFIFAVFIVRI